jgi:hypothetical protein
MMVPLSWLLASHARRLPAPAQRFVLDHDGLGVPEQLALRDDLDPTLARVLADRHPRTLALLAMRADRERFDADLVPTRPNRAQWDLDGLDRLLTQPSATESERAGFFRLLIDEDGPIAGGRWLVSALPRAVVSAAARVLVWRTPLEGYALELATQMLFECWQLSDDERRELVETVVSSDAEHPVRHVMLQDLRLHGDQDPATARWGTIAACVHPDKVDRATMLAAPAPTLVSIHLAGYSAQLLHDEVAARFGEDRTALDLLDALVEGAPTGSVEELLMTVTLLRRGSARA